MTPHRCTQLLGAAGLTAALVLRAAISCADTFTFDFAQSDFGWTAGFVDYPANADPEFYALQSDYRSRPANLGGAGSIFISGQNHSDDLFMFIKKSLSGLAPHSLCEVRFSVELASQDETGLGGIGGSPGDSVYLKVGASRFEPIALVDQSGYYRLNLDKGDQAQEGADALVLGTIAKPQDDNRDYVLIERNNMSRPLKAWTSAAGDLWLFVGTDSGFEGPTSLYYTRIVIGIDVIANPLRFTREGEDIRLEWDAGVLQSAATVVGEWNDVPNATSPWQENLAGEQQKFWRVRAK